MPGAATPGIGDPQAPPPDTTYRPATTRSARGAAGHSRRENGQGPPSPLRPRRPPRKNSGSHAPARQCPNLSPPLLSLQSWRIRPAGFLGANPIPRSPPRGPSQVAWCCMPGIGDPQVPAPDAPCRPTTTGGARGVANPSGRQNGQDPPSHLRPLKTPRAKAKMLWPPLRIKKIKLECMLSFTI